MTQRRATFSTITADMPHVLYAVRVIFERKPIDNPWITHKWRVHDLIPLNKEAGSGEVPSGFVSLMPLHQDKQAKTEQAEQAKLAQGKELYMADILVDLHRAEAESYAENLQSSDPSIYVVLRDSYAEDEQDSEGLAADMCLVQVSLSAYAIQDFEDCGEDQVEKLPLQGPIAEFVAAFVEAHFKPETFVKRKRGAARIDADEQRGGDERVREGGVFAAPKPKSRLH